MKNREWQNFYYNVNNLRLKMSSKGLLLPLLHVLLASNAQKVVLELRKNYLTIIVTLLRLSLHVVLVEHAHEV